MKRWKAIASALALGLGLSGGAWAQQHPGVWDIQNGTTMGRNDRGGWGWQQGRDNDGDRDDNPQWRRDRDRDGDRDRDHGYRNGPYYPNGAYGYPGRYPNGSYGVYGRGNYGYNQAAQVGYQDGLNDGRNDYMSRRNYQPQKDSNYKHADRGYNSGFGNKNGYKDAYRNAYLQGYQQGYGQGGYYGRGPWGR